MMRLRAPRRTSRRHLIAAFSLGIALHAATGCADPPTSTEGAPGPVRSEIRDLVGLGGLWARARAINNFGRVVGDASLTASTIHAFSWSELGGIRDLGTLGGPLSAAAAINAQSQIVGWSITRNGVQHAFVVTAGEVMRDLGTPQSGIASEASDINDSGMVVGNWLTATGETRVFVWTQAAGMRDVPGAARYQWVRANAINAHGQIAGVGMDRNAGTSRALIWEASGDVREVGTLPGAAESIALAINIGGHVVGASGVAAGAYRAFLWTPTNGMRDLGVLEGMDWSIARDISDRGHVVGSSGPSGSTAGRAFLWTESGGMRELAGHPASDRTESGAFGVNWYGRVVGYSWNGSTFRPVIFPDR